jgi:hypothetical protein
MIRSTCSHAARLQSPSLSVTAFAASSPGKTTTGTVAGRADRRAGCPARGRASSPVRWSVLTYQLGRAAPLSERTRRHLDRWLCRTRGLPRVFSTRAYRARRHRRGDARHPSESGPRDGARGSHDPAAPAQVAARRAGRRRAANRAEWFNQVDKPLEVHEILGA